jgi:hypothetical protein
MTITAGRLTELTFGLLAFSFFAFPAGATTLYQETFSTGAALTSDPLVNSSAIGTYFLTGTGNAYVTTSSYNDASTGTVDGPVNAPPSGISSPYFLVEGTANNNTSGNNVFFASSNITVAANTNYTVSYELTNANNVSFATVGLQVNGISLISAQSASGYYADGIAGDGWQTFSVTWNSGSATTAAITLTDTNTQQNGNDFAVDNIQLASASSSTPEPSTMVLFGTALVGLGSWRIRRRRAAVSL